MTRVLLQLSLPGASRFLGELTPDGCREIASGAATVETDAGQGGVDGGRAARLLVCDGLDRRFVRSSAWRAAALLRRAGEDEPGVEHRFVLRPGDPRVAWLRPADDVPEDIATVPLGLALELLFPGSPGERGVAVLELGPEGHADVLLMAGRDEDGQVDPDSLQIWIRPQDSTGNIAREFAQRGGFDLPDDAPVRRQEDLLEISARLPSYPHARTVLGRTGDEWLAAASRVAAFGLLASIVTGGAALLDVRSLRSDAGRAHVAIEATRARVAQSIARSPARLAQAASVDFPALVAAARQVWRPGAVVQAIAHGDSRTLVARWKLPRVAATDSVGGPANPGLIASGGALAAAGKAHGAAPGAQEIALAWSRNPPAGFVRAQAAYSGDGDELAISFQSAAAPSRAALRALD